MEHTNVPFTLVLNKCDLCDETTRADWGARLEQWGYYPRFVSVATGEGVDELEAELAVGMSHNRALDGRGDGVGSIDDDDDEDEEDEGRTSDTGVAPRSVTVLAGPSGVGKSSLINRLRAGSKLAEALAAAGELEEEDGDCAIIGVGRPYRSTPNLDWISYMSTVPPSCPMLFPMRNKCGDFAMSSAPPPVHTKT